MNPHDQTQAELLWMTSAERLERAARRAAGVLSLLVAAGGTAWVAVAWESDPSFLLAHGAAAAGTLGGAASWAGPALLRAARQGWARWGLAVLESALVACGSGLGGVLAAGMALRLLGHPRPWGPLVFLDPGTLGLLTGSTLALSIAACGAWALTWRWFFRDSPTG